ncbi:MAG: hypothetical protein GY754_20695 [bacterium]|nr:hypothetical protein [bacterium]
MSHTDESSGYPDSLKEELQKSEYENIVDTNIFSAYITEDLDIPPIEDPRKAHHASDENMRHPEYIRSIQINQAFSYIGFVRRINNKELGEYLPVVFDVLKHFIRIVEEIVMEALVAIPEEIYTEQNRGYQQFLESFHRRKSQKKDWTEKIWKHQKIYLERINMLLETLKVSGQVFNYESDPVYEKVVSFCRKYFHNAQMDPPGEADIHFVANCCARAVRDNQPKMIWSGDMHIVKIIRGLYYKSPLHSEFPQLYVRSGYMPLQYQLLFPDPEDDDQ